MISFSKGISGALILNMSINEHTNRSYILFFFILFMSIKECSLIIIKWPFIVFSNSSAPLNDFLFLKNSDNF